MITRLARWLCPALLGPLLAIFVYITVAVLVGDCDPKLGRWGCWVLGMIFGTLFGGMLGLMLLVTDAILLRLRLRLLPMGGRAWLAGIAAPMIVFAVWHVWRPDGRDGWRLSLALLAPMVAAAIGLRLLFSPRIRKQGS